MTAQGDGAPDALGEGAAAWVATVEDALGFTVSQGRQLRGWVARYVACQEDPLPELPAAFLRRSTSKRERRSKLGELRRQLAVKR
jgi:hypothetical protein